MKRLDCLLDVSASFHTEGEGSWRICADGGDASWADCWSSAPGRRRLVAHSHRRADRTLMVSSMRTSLPLAELISAARGAAQISSGYL